MSDGIAIAIITVIGGGFIATTGAIVVAAIQTRNVGRNVGATNGSGSIATMMETQGRALNHLLSRSDTQEEWNITHQAEDNATAAAVEEIRAHLMG